MLNRGEEKTRPFFWLNWNRTVRIVLLLLPLICLYAQAEDEVFHAGHKKLLYYEAANRIKTDSLSGPIAALQSMPFDGVIAISHNQSNWHCNFEGRAWAESEMQLDELSQTQWGKLTDNFLLFFPNNGPVAIEWFDDTFWQTAIANVGLLSKALNAGGFKGICLDPEFYYGSDTYNPFSYNSSIYPQRSFDEVRAKVRQRAAAFMAALQSSKPDVQVFALFLLSNTSAVTTQSAPYSLLPAFVDGMLDAATPQTVITDGQEQCYYVKETRMYTEGWWLPGLNPGMYGYAYVRQQSQQLLSPENQSKVAQQLRVGEGVYPNLYYGIGWNFGFSADYQSKWWEHNVYHSLLAADEYVWMYSEGFDWFNTGAGSPPPADALSQISSARQLLAAGQPLGYEFVDNTDPGSPSVAATVVSDSSVNITSPVHNSQFTPGAPIQVNVNVNVNAANVTSVVLYVNSVEAGTLTSAPYTFTVPALQVPSCTLLARAFMSDGTHMSSNPVDLFAGAAESPFGGTAWTIPGTIEAENYDLGGEGVAYHDSDPANNGGAYRNDGVDIRACIDTNGGYQVGWTATGEWLNYTVNVATSGNYTLTSRVASGGGGGTIHFEFDGVNVSGPITIPNTGSYDTWQSITQSVQLTAGPHIMRVVIDSSAGFDMNWFSFAPPESPFGGTAWTIPGTIEAENYDLGGEGVAYHDSDPANNGGAYRNDGVDIRACIDTNGGYQVGWTATGEWLNYTVNVAASGNYTLTSRVASGGGGGTIHFEFDGVNVSGPITIPNTGSYDTWQSITQSVQLTAGQHIMRVFIDSSAGFDLNWFAFSLPPNLISPATATPPSALTGQTVTFNAAAADANGDTLAYSWDFGDGTSGSGATLTHVYSSTGTFTATVTISDGSGNAITSSVPVAVSTLNTTVQINSGGSASGTFAADTGFSGGYLYRTTAPIDTSAVTNPAPQGVYQTERYGNFTYTVGGLTAGSPYTVRLHFAEIYWSSAGQRLFNVSINGQQVIANFDIYAAAGGNFIAIVKEFTVSADSNGQITITYSTLKDNAKSSGIEVLTPASGAILNAFNSPAVEATSTLTHIDLGTVSVNKPFKLKLDLPETGKAAAKLHWKAANPKQLPHGVRASGAYLGGKPTTAGSYTFQLEFKSADGKLLSNTYSLTVTH